MATITEVPTSFDFAGHYGPPNETMAPEHLPVCVVYGETGLAEFGSYVVYPSAARRGPSRIFVLVNGDGSLAGAHEFNRAMMHAVS
jgi:hypothetical protein